MEERKKVLLEAEAELETIFLQTKGVSKEDMSKIFSPLQVAHRRAHLRKIAFIVAPVVLTLLTIYCSGVAQLHLHALTRITLVQVFDIYFSLQIHNRDYKKCNNVTLKMIFLNNKNFFKQRNNLM